jgi:hypothetical protein
MPARYCMVFLYFDFRTDASDQQMGTGLSNGWVWEEARFQIMFGFCISNSLST